MKVRRIAAQPVGAGLGGRGFAAAAQGGIGQAGLVGAELPGQPGFGGQGGLPVVAGVAEQGGQGGERRGVGYLGRGARGPGEAGQNEVELHGLRGGSVR